MLPNKPLEGQTYPLRIEGYSSDGAGVARLDGMVVFVQGGVRGELCQVRLTHVGRSALWGKVTEVIGPSTARVVSRVRFRETKRASLCRSSSLAASCRLAW